ncbi:transcriptional repressor [Kordiimonas gwangyangensis]|uniref:transcriptional repressor n=1 Tax=Kordiimonas gwangyangensis TaxID=288022 RepID=UPI0003605319|nr:transcriptional repressor [Kordiimonas gwangyangensis]
MGHSHSHDHSICIETAIAEAERLCAERGSRFTDLRRRILKMIWQGHKAVKAYDLLDQLATEGGSAKPPTVYRALDFLMEEGLVHKIESLNAYIGCPHPGDNHVSQFLICDKCETVKELSSDELTTAVMNAAKQANFAIRRQTLELHGVCANCQRNREAA